MFVKILKKDLRRNKTMNIILLLFIVLATIFVASGLNNLVSVMNGTDYYMDEAGVGDYFMLVISGSDDSSLRKTLDEGAGVKSYKFDRALFTSDKIKNSKGEELDDSMHLIQSIDETEITMFDADNKAITAIDKGHVYVTRAFLRDNDIEIGDKIWLSFKNYEKCFIVDGKAKDALLGSNFMGNTRFLLNDEDMKEFFEVEGSDQIEGRIAYIEASNVKDVKSVAANVERVQFQGERSLIVLTYMLDMIVAFVIVILSICLIIVAFVILKFSIGFTIQDDFREIGVMKAIGIRNNKIRSLYMVKYNALAFFGAVVGLALSYPFGNMLMKSVTENMVLGNSYGYLLNLLGAVLVFIVIVGLAFLSTGRIKKMTPVDAIRSGETGERFKKKKGLRISRSHSKNYLYLAWNDIISSPKRFANVIISFSICTLFVLMLSNLTNTMDSNAFIEALASRADLYMAEEDASDIDTSDIFGEEDTNPAEFSSFLYRENGEELYRKYLKKLEEKIKEEGMDVTLSSSVTYTYKYEYNGKEYSSRAVQPLDSISNTYKALEGSIPQNKNEIMITPIVAKNTGAKIGDTLKMDFDGTKENCIISGIYECMNNAGDIIMLHPDAPTSFLSANFASYEYIYFNDNPSDEELNERKEKLRDIFNTEMVMDQRELCVKDMNALDSMKSVEYLLMGVTVLVILLVTIMMERSFIADEKKQIAILKAIGFRDGDVVKWQVTRFGLLAVISGVISAILSIPFSKFGVSPIFKSMGMSNVNIFYNFGSLAKYPVIIVALTIAFAWIVSLYTSTVKARDTASIE